MARPITRPIEQAENFPGIGQRNKQHMVTPRPIIGDVHALFAFARGLHQVPIHINDGFLEKTLGLSGPNLQPRFVDGVMQPANLKRRVEAAAEISRRRWVRNALCA